MDEAVEDGVGERGIFELAVPELDGQLAGDNDAAALGFTSDQSVSAAAVSRARRSLKPSVFEALNARLLTLIADTLPSTRWQDLRVMAVDGSVLNLPKTRAMFCAFGGQRMAKTQNGLMLPIARFSQLYDIDSGLTWHAIVQPNTHGEGVAAAGHLAHSPANALILCDRGYPSYFLVARHVQLQRHFCMRISRGFSRETDQLFYTDQRSSVFQLKPNRDAQTLCKKQAKRQDMLSGAFRNVLPNITASAAKTAKHGYVRAPSAHRQWSDSSDHQLARFTRSPSGPIEAITKWPDSGCQRLAPMGPGRIGPGEPR